VVQTSSSNRKGDQLQTILEEFVSRTPEVLIAIAATREGLSIASVKNGAIAKEEDALAVAAARILDMAAEVNNQLNQGDIGRILIEGAKRTTIVIGAGRDIALIVAVPADAKLGLAMLSIRNTAQSIAQIYD
jgi:predicted regulator of Ras-like GTPase activity (Roadblock/LC7/MglB family)